MALWEKEFDDLFFKLNELEREISMKADEIVMIQVLEHRKELEQIEERLNELETKMHLLWHKNNQKIEKNGMDHHKEIPLLKQIAHDY